MKKTRNIIQRNQEGRRAKAKKQELVKKVHGKNIIIAGSRLIEILKRDRKDLIVKPEKTTIDENLEGSGNSKSGKVKEKFQTQEIRTIEVILKRVGRNFRYWLSPCYLVPVRL